MPAPPREAWLRRKPVTAMTAESGADEGTEGALRRSIGLVQLTSFGVGATVGTGIFFVMSEATPEAGPAVVVSFVLAAITAGLALGRPLEEAVTEALDYVHRAIAAAPGLGGGHGPLDHTVAVRGRG